MKITSIKLIMIDGYANQLNKPIREEESDVKYRITYSGLSICPGVIFLNML